MKLLSLIIILFTAFISISQEECKPYMPISVGSTWEITNYSKKDKESGKISYELLAIAETDSSTLFTIKAVSYDDKEEVTYENEYTAECVNGIFKLDMSVFVNGEAMAAYKDMEVEMDASEFNIPTMEEAVGTTLDDGQLTMKIASNGVQMYTMTIYVTDRAVEARESLTTSAGTFDCIKITQKVTTKMIVKIQATSKEWYAENIGMVRSESYNKKGKLTGYSVLTKISN